MFGAAIQLIGRVGRGIGSWLPNAKAESLAPEAAAICCFLLLPWIGITVALHHEYHSAEAAAAQSTGTLARALEESTRRTIGQIDYILLSARAMQAAEGERFDFHEWVRNQTFTDKMTAQIAITDSTGLVTGSTVALPPGISVGDRPHFRAQVDPAHDDLFISDPVTGRVTGLQTIQFTRKLFGPGGAFGGIVVFSLGSVELARFYESLALGRGFVAILSAGGTILARGPLVPGLTGSNIKGTAGFRDVLDHAAGSVSLGATPGQDAQIASFRRLHDYPLIVMVGFDTDTVFGPYRSLRQNALLSGVINPRVLQLLAKPDEKPEAAMQYVAARAIELIPETLRPSASPDAGQGADGPGQDSKFETTLRSGAIIEIRTHALADRGFVQTYTDVTEQRVAHAQVRHLAHHDALTGLANRVELLQRVSDIVEDRSGTLLTALMMIDLDGFKGVNDTLGHDAGDKLLVEVGRRLRPLVRGSDMVARLGGDEFVILAVGLGQRDDVVPLAKRVLRRLADPMQVNDQQIRIGASVGIAFYPRDGLDVDTLFRHADLALYSAKTAGRGVYRCFDEQLSQAAADHRQLESDLRQALDAEALEVYFQPKFSAVSLRVVGFEALARWPHPTRGYVSPDVFIRIAEDCGLINRLGRWILEQVCKSVATWEPRLPVAVNVSVMQLQDGGLKDDIAAVLGQTGLQSEHLEIEVTESVLADDNQTVLGNLKAIKAMGIRIALDDFGTGYSSLSYLRRFSFDKIKIDKAFVQGQADDPGVRVILEAILGMCNNLGLATIAEGVETQEQLQLLQALGCSEIQGYLLGRPMPRDRVQTFIRSHLGSPAATGPLGAEPETASVTQ
ncbi:MAG: EAL domain-containing protein [Rhodopila sp.]